MWTQKTASLFGTIALLAIAIAILVFFYEMSLLARSLRVDLGALTANTNALLVTANQAAGQARDASEQAKLAAVEQRAYWNKTSLETYKTMASLRLTIVRVDHSVNDDLAPRLGRSLDATTDLSRTAAANLARTMEELQPTLSNLGRASAAAAVASEEASKIIADPHIRETLANLEETSAFAKATADASAQTMQHVEGSTRDIQAYVHRETAPARGTWNLFRELLSLTWQARGAIAK
jgi:hypothetical protein